MPEPATFQLATTDMWNTFIQPRTVDETVQLLTQYGKEARIISGGTDLIIEMERKIRAPQVIIDVSRLPNMDYVREDGDYIRLGAGVTHNQAVGTPAEIGTVSAGAAQLHPAQSAGFVGHSPPHTVRPLAGPHGMRSPKHELNCGALQQRRRTTAIQRRYKADQIGGRGEPAAAALRQASARWPCSPPCRA